MSNPRLPLAVRTIDELRLAVATGAATGARRAFLANPDATESEVVSAVEAAVLEAILLHHHPAATD